MKNPLSLLLSTKIDGGVQLCLSIIEVFHSMRAALLAIPPVIEVGRKPTDYA